MSYPPPTGRSGNKVLNRAYAAGAALAVGTVAITGIFVAKIANSYAATHSGGSGGSATNQGTDNGSTDGTSGGGQVSVPQQSQSPVGGSNGS